MTPREEGFYNQLIKGSSAINPYETNSTINNLDRIKSELFKSGQDVAANIQQRARENRTRR